MASMKAGVIYYDDQTFVTGRNHPSYVWLAPKRQPLPHLGIRDVHPRVPNQPRTKTLLSPHSDHSEAPGTISRPHR